MEYLIAVYAAVALCELVIWGREVGWALAGMARARALLDRPLTPVTLVVHYVLFIAVVIVGAVLWPLAPLITSRSLLHPYNRFSVMRQAMRGVYMAHSQR